MLFLPGKYEIDTVEKGLEEPGIDTHCFFLLEDVMDEDSIETSKQPTGSARCILLTSKGKSAVIVADVDHVIDSGSDRLQWMTRRKETWLLLGRR